MKKHCGNCANHKKETYQLSDECGKCVAAILENGERTDPSHWREKPKTNADRIRAMSDEELAVALANSVIDVLLMSHDMSGEQEKVPKYLRDSLTQNYLKWLREPAEGE